MSNRKLQLRSQTIERRRPVPGDVPKFRGSDYALSVIQDVLSLPQSAGAHEIVSRIRQLHNDVQRLTQERDEARDTSNWAVDEVYDLTTGERTAFRIVFDPEGNHD